MARFASYSRKRMWRTLLAIVGGTALVCAAYIFYLDWLVTHQFEGRRWTLPAQVYAAPLELYSGLQLSTGSSTPAPTGRRAAASM